MFFLVTWTVFYVWSVGKCNSAAKNHSSARPCKRPIAADHAARTEGVGAKVDYRDALHSKMLLR